MSRRRPEKPPVHTVAAEAALRAETVTADEARRTAAFGKGRVSEAPGGGDAGPGAHRDGQESGSDTEPRLRALVLTVSDRCSAGEREDRSGPLAAQLLAEHGVDAQVRVVPDGEDSVREALTAALAEGFRFVLTTGGTGVGPRDRTPEGTRPLLDLALPGLAQAMRDAGALAENAVPTAVLSRGLAGVALGRDGGSGAGGALIVNAPGSTGGVRDALGVVGPLVAHVLSQLDGGDH